MARGQKEDTKAIIPAAGTPNFLDMYKEKPDMSLATLEEHRIVPRFKIIQQMTSQELQKLFDQGDVIVNPGELRVIKYDKKSSQSSKIRFVPEFMFTEFIKWADREDKESSMILERTFDPTTPLAKMCRDFTKRTVPYSPPRGTKEKPWLYRYCEHLNFIGHIYGEEAGDAQGIQITLSFSRGSFKDGKALINKILARRNSVPVLWAHVLQLSVSMRNSGKGDFFVLNTDFADPPVITNEEAEFFKSQADELAALHAKGRVGVDHGELDDEESSVPLDESKM